MGEGAFTLLCFAMPVDRIEALSDISNLFYISVALGTCWSLYGNRTPWMRGRNEHFLQPH